MEVDCQRHALATLPLGMIWYSLYRRLGGLQGQSGWVLIISPLLGLDPRIVQPVASCCINYAIPAHDVHS
jgi:hypothetical protein